MIVVGVDPGLSGFACLLSTEAHHLPAFFPVPVSDGDYDQEGMVDLARDLADTQPTLVVVEKQGVLPRGRGGVRRGMIATASLLKGYGLWLGVLRGAGLRVEEVPSAEWRIGFGVGAGTYAERKKKSVVKATTIAPKVDFRAEGRRKPSHDKCESYLLALHARKLLKRETAS